MIYIRDWSGLAFAWGRERLEREALSAGMSADGYRECETAARSRGSLEAAECWGRLAEMEETAERRAARSASRSPLLRLPVPVPRSERWETRA